MKYLMNVWTPENADNLFILTNEIDLLTFATPILKFERHSTVPRNTKQVYLEIDDAITLLENQTKILREEFNKNKPDNLLIKK